MAACLVTGGAGFIGSHLVEALLAQGHQVRVLDSLVSGKLDNLAGVKDQIEFIQADLRDDRAVAQAVAGVEIIFHLAAMVSVPESMAHPVEAELINTVGSLRLLQAAKEAGVRRLVLSSTCAIYGDEPTLPKVETMLPEPKSPYAISKLSAEQYCRLFYQAFGLETVLLRYFNVYGPRQDPSSPYSGVISVFVDRLSQGRIPSIYGDGLQTRDFVYVGDVVRANLLAAATPQAAGQLFNIGGGHQITINQLFEDLCYLFEVEAQPVYAPGRPGDVIHSCADASRAAAILGWSPQVELRDGLWRLIQALQS
jgi:nucleoside-diphosphate-sugar epimerase